MISLSFGGTSVKVYDQLPLIGMLDSLGIDSEELSTVNRFCYGALPEGSYGNFLIAAKDLATLSPGNFPVTLTIVGQKNTFTHVNLAVTNIRYFEVPTTGWTLSPTAQIESKFAIVEVKDRWSGYDALIRKDFNRVTIFAPYNTANYYEPEQTDLMTFAQIFTQLASDYPLGTAATFDTSGFPTIKPTNVLSTGSVFRELINYIADVHFLVAYFDKATGGGGKIVITDAQSGSTQLIPDSSNQIVYSSYGSEALPKELTTLFSTQGHPFSKQRTTILSNYYANWSNEWAYKDTTLVADNDSVLAHNSRNQSTTLAADTYYPYYDPGRFNTTDASCTTISDKLATNFSKRTQRSVVIAFKDIVLLDPSMTVQKIEYVYDANGLTTILTSIPPNPISVKPEITQIARGMEYVPPMLRGLVVETGADYDSLRYGYAPGDHGILSLQESPYLEVITPFYVKFLVAGSQQVFLGDFISVIYNIHTREYEFVDECERLFQFEITSSWVDGVNEVSLIKPDGTATTGVVDIQDPLLKFQHLVIGDKGYMIYATDDKYYAILPTETGGGIIEYTITSLTDLVTGPYSGLTKATVVIRGAPCNRTELINTTVDVIDHSGCIFDEADMTGYTGWATEMIFASLDEAATCSDLTPCHWVAINRCCAASSGIYAAPCSSGV